MCVFTIRTWSAQMLDNQIQFKMERKTDVKKQNITLNSVITKTFSDTFLLKLNVPNFSNTILKIHLHTLPTYIHGRLI